MAKSRIRYQFGPFCLEVDRRLLLRNGEPMTVAPKALQTLLTLIERRDRVITKDELLAQIWGETIIEEGGLTRNIAILRKTLGEKPDDHQYIVTVPGAGYRFVADVREVAEDANPPDSRTLPFVNVEPQAVAGTPVAQTGTPPSGWLSMVRGMALAGLAALAAASYVFIVRPMRAVDVGRPTLAALAVLPLENLSGDLSQEYFADGMTEALIGNLARLRALRVVSRTSVMRFKRATTSLPEIARALNVDAIVEGSVHRTGDRVRISVQLVHAATDTHLWAREYERELSDVLTLQAEVARAVAEEIHVQVTAEERARLASAGPVNPAAYQEFLLGQHYLWKLDEESLARAIAHFEQSTRLDPDYAAAYAGLSHAWWWRGIWGAVTFRQVESPSRTAAAKALALDPGLAEAHVSSGRIKFGHEWDWAGAEKDFRTALAIDPNNVDAHFFSAMLCMAVGCFAESVAHIKRVEQMDPLSPTVQSFVGRVLYRARKFDEAIIHFNRAIELEPQSPVGAYHRLAEVHEAIGRYLDALALLEKAARFENRGDSQLLTARIFARMGKRREARKILEGARGSNRQLLAMVHAALGDKDDAFRLLFQIVEDPDFNVYVKTDPAFDNLHSDPRWQEIVRRMRFPTEAISTP